jgi:uncharacterized protein Usg
MRHLCASFRYAPYDLAPEFPKLVDFLDYWAAVLARCIG